MPVKKIPAPPATPDIPLFTVVVVEWEDAYVNAAAQHASVTDALAAFSPCIRRSVGHYIGEKDGCVLLATDDDRTTEFKEACSGIMHIPKSLLRCPPIVMGHIKLKFP